MSFSAKTKKELTEFELQNTLNTDCNKLSDLFKLFNSAQTEKNKEHQKNIYAEFLRKVFINYGNIINPEIEYHLELDINSPDLSNLIIYTFKNCDALGYTPGITQRRNHIVLYLKGSEKITDFLVFIGASKSAMELMQIKMVKEVRNNINRTTNFETANLSKITNSSTEQINAIKKIKHTIGIESLPEHLKEIALIRINNPYLSLKELSKLYTPPISKSGINHRLKKLIEISSEL